MERTVRVGLTTYRAVDGRYRLAQTGQVVDVHPDYLPRFDRLNVLAGQTPADTPPAESTAAEPAAPAPKRTRAQRKED
ncbi:hypothetical protein [Nocardia thailandica]|uniref:hypothetical protein n=1 Tax=Nocardia thailandica TaxID=257275 RepID=UPI0002DAED8C|nr:hypothetical protein [Nocardia thailandica]